MVGPSKNRKKNDKNVFWLVVFVFDHVKEKLELANTFIYIKYICRDCGSPFRNKMSARGDSEIKFQTTPFIIGRYPQNLTEISNFCSKNSNFGQTNQIVQFNGILNLTAGKSRQGTITSLVPVSSNQNEHEMIEKDGF